MNITLKKVPQDIYRLMKQEAEEQGRSLNTQIIQVLRYEASEVQRRKRMTRTREELDKFSASLPTLSDSTPLIRQDRKR